MLQKLLLQKLSHEANLIATYEGYLNNVIDIYQGSNPEQTKLIKKSIEEFDKKIIEKHISAISTLSELDMAEKVKLLFKTEQMLEDVQIVTNLIVGLLTSVDIKSSVSSSSTAYAYDYIKKMLENITSLNTKHQIYLKEIKQNLYDEYVSTLFTSLNLEAQRDNVEKLGEIISTTYKKYPKSRYLYAAILNHITQAYPVYGKRLISEIEILKDEALQIDLSQANQKTSCILMNMMQHYDLMPDGLYRKLDVIFEDLGLKCTKLEEASKLLSAQKPTGFVIINKIPEKWSQTCEYRVWNICSSNRDSTSGNSENNIDPDFAIDKKTLEAFDTIQVIKVDKTKNYIKYVGVANPVNIIVLDNLNDKYRILSPWGIFPVTKSTQGIPSNWLDLSMKKHPAIRVQAYNRNFESEVLKYVKEVKEFPDIDNDEEVMKTRAAITDALTSWFDKKISVTLDSFREKMLSGEMEDMFYECVMDALNKFNKHDNVYLTCLSVANQLTNKFNREMVYQVKSFKSNVFNEMNMENLKSYMRTYFKDMIVMILEIIITDNTLFNIVVTKKTTLDIEN